MRTLRPCGGRSLIRRFVEVSVDVSCALHGEWKSVRWVFVCTFVALSLQLLVFALCCVPGTPGSCMCFRFCPRPYRVGCLCADLIACEVCVALSFVCVWVYVCACSENVGRCCILVWSMFGMWICLYVTSMYKAIGWFCGCCVPCRLGLHELCVMVFHIIACIYLT